MNTLRVEPATGRPLPVQYAEERPFWEAAKEERLVLQRCNDCSHCWYPIGAVCPRCLSEDFVWDVMAGTGTVRARVIYHKAFVPYFADRLPYVVGLVELDEGPRLTTTIVDIAAHDVEIGLRVRTRFEHVNDEVSLVMFAPDATP